MAKVVLKLGDDISTDIIYPGRFMATVLPTETPQYTFADITDFNARLNKGEIPAGGVVVGGKNFGCGLNLVRVQLSGRKGVFKLVLHLVDLFKKLTSLCRQFYMLAPAVAPPT